MTAITNAHANAWSRLAKHAVERTHRGVAPARAITAPEPQPPHLAMLTEPERLATFDQSSRTQRGNRADYRKPKA